MIRKLLVLAAALVVLAASPAAAGGWAVSTLDQPPSQLVAGQDTPLGFTIRQHGQTPVNPDSGTVGIRLVNQASGQAFEFAATQTGPTGHYVATVRVPSAGSWSWEVLQGWFAPQDLGTIAVVGSGGAAGASASPSAAPTSQAGGTAGPEWWRIGAFALAGLVVLAFVTDLVLGRRAGRRPADRGAGAPAT
jgi:hypothetical protein